MKYYRIEVDKKVWNYLKGKAEPFEDTPNAVLNRLLFGEYDQTNEQIPVFPEGTPKGLEQILEVLFEIRKLGRTRSEATNNVACRRNTPPQTVSGKYCRELGKKAYEIDHLLQEPDLSGFKSLLENKFVHHRDLINSFFETLQEREVERR